MKVLKQGGILVSTNIDFQFSDVFKKALAEKGAKGELVAIEMKQEWLEQIAQLIDAGKVPLTISRVYPL